MLLEEDLNQYWLWNKIKYAENNLRFLFFMLPKSAYVTLRDIHTATS